MPPDVSAFTEAMRRLSVLRCIKHDGESMGNTEPRGRFIISIKRSVGSLVDFHVAYLLASIGVHREKLSMSVMRVIVRIAAILSHGIHTLCTNNLEDAFPSLEQVRAHCEGVGKELASKGAIWIALGLWQSMAQVEILPSEDGQFRNILHAGVSISTSAASEVQMRVAIFEDLLKIPHTTAELGDTKLSGDEIVFVERPILWAYLHRAVYLADNPSALPVDVVSRREFTTSEGEILDLNVPRVAEENKGGCFAIYTGLLLSGSRFVASGLTLIPRQLIREVEKVDGMPFDQAVATKYPLAA